MNVAVSMVYAAVFAVETVPPSRSYVIVYVIRLVVAVTVTSLAGMVNVFPVIAVPFTLTLVKLYPSAGLTVTVSPGNAFAVLAVILFVPTLTLYEGGISVLPSNAGHVSIISVSVCDNAFSTFTTSTVPLISVPSTIKLLPSATVTVPP